MNQTINKIINFIKKSSFIFFFSIIVFFLMYFYYSVKTNTTKKYNYKVGDIAKEDIVVKEDISYIDEEETNKRKNELLSSITPVYLLYESKFDEAYTRFDSLFNYLEQKNFKITENEKGIEEKLQLKNVDEKTLKVLKEIFKQKDYKERFFNALKKLYESGITFSNKNELQASNTQKITIYWYRKNEVITKTSSINDIITKDTIYKKVYNDFYSYFPFLKRSSIQTITNFVIANISENLFFDPSNTKKIVDETLSNFKPVKNILKKGKIIVRHGEEILPKDIKKIEIINEHTSNINYVYILGVFLIYILFFTLYYFILNNYYSKITKNIRHTLYLIFNYLLIFIYFGILTIFQSVKFPVFLLIPIGLSHFFIEIVYDEKTSFILFLSISFLLFILSNFNWIYLVYPNMLNLLLSIKINKFEKIKLKNKILYKSSLIFIYNLIFVLILYILGNFKNLKISTLILLSFSNALLTSILFFGLNPILEILFNFATVYKLIDLCDLNNPIFSEFMVKAPGSYHHSIIVANLSEKAALACNANPYLAKAGALYHDIGKMKHARYFIENQNLISDKRDKLNPSMAVSIIKNHVKQGIEIAKKLKLPEEIIKIIEEHHGKTVITYFYQKALENSYGSNISKEDFVYDYSKPTSKESAIVMLADSIEAISRVLETYNYNHIEKVIKDLINKRFLDGQLDDAPLTLSDLKKIEKSFIENVSAMLHQRIDYPDEKEIRILEKQVKKGKLKNNGNYQNG